MNLFTRASTNTNPPNADLHITPHTTDWLWAVFAIMVFSDLLVLFAHFRRPVGTRLFHQIAVVVLTVAVIAYYSMASDLGATPIAIEFTRGRPIGTTRQIWYVRYIQWVINAPLILLEVLLVSGVALSDIFTTLFMSVVLVICGLIGALVRTRYKWGYFVFGVCAFLYIAHNLVFHAPRTNFSAGAPVRRTFLAGAGTLAFIWALYPLCWALSEGGNVIGPTGEMVFYGILDIISGPLFLGYFLLSTRGVDYAAFGLGGQRTGAYNRGPGMLEKGNNNGAGPNRMSGATDTSAPVNTN